MLCLREYVIVSICRITQLSAYVKDIFHTKYQHEPDKLPYKIKNGLHYTVL